MTLPEKLTTAMGKLSLFQKAAIKQGSPQTQIVGEVFQSSSIDCSSVEGLLRRIAPDSATFPTRPSWMMGPLEYKAVSCAAHSILAGAIPPNTSSRFAEACRATVKDVFRLRLCFPYRAHFYLAGNTVGRLRSLPSHLRRLLDLPESFYVALQSSLNELVGDVVYVQEVAFSAYLMCLAALVECCAVEDVGSICCIYAEDITRPFRLFNGTPVEGCDSFAVGVFKDDGLGECPFCGGQYPPLIRSREHSSTEKRHNMMFPNCGLVSFFDSPSTSPCWCPPPFPMSGCHTSHLAWFLRCVLSLGSSVDPLVASLPFRGNMLPCEILSEVKDRLIVVEDVCFPRAETAPKALTDSRSIFAALHSFCLPTNQLPAGEIIKKTLGRNAWEGVSNLQFVRHIAFLIVNKELWEVGQLVAYAKAFGDSHFPSGLFGYFSTDIGQHGFKCLYRDKWSPPGISPTHLSMGSLYIPGYVGCCGEDSASRNGEGRITRTSLTKPHPALLQCQQTSHWTDRSCDSIDSGDARPNADGYGAQDGRGCEFDLDSHSDLDSHPATAFEQGNDLQAPAPSGSLPPFLCAAFLAAPRHTFLASFEAPSQSPESDCCLVQALRRHLPLLTASGAFEEVTPPPRMPRCYIPLVAIDGGRPHTQGGDGDFSPLEALCSQATRLFVLRWCSPITGRRVADLVPNVGCRQTLLTRLEDEVATPVVHVEGLVRLWAGCTSMDTRTALLREPSPVDPFAFKYALGCLIRLNADQHRRTEPPPSTRSRRGFCHDYTRAVHRMRRCSSAKPGNTSAAQGVEGVSPNQHPIRHLVDAFTQQWNEGKHQDNADIFRASATGRVRVSPTFQCPESQLREINTTAARLMRHMPIGIPGIHDAAQALAACVNFCANCEHASLAAMDHVATVCSTVNEQVDPREIASPVELLFSILCSSMWPTELGFPSPSAAPLKSFVANRDVYAAMWAERLAHELVANENAGDGLFSGAIHRIVAPRRVSGQCRGCAVAAAFHCAIPDVHPPPISPWLPTELAASEAACITILTGQPPPRLPPSDSASVSSPRGAWVPTDLARPSGESSHNNPTSVPLCFPCFLSLGVTLVSTQTADASQLTPLCKAFRSLPSFDVVKSTKADQTRRLKTVSELYSTVFSWLLQTPCSELSTDDTPCAGTLAGVLHRRVLPQLQDAIHSLRLSPQEDPRPFVAVALSNPAHPFDVLGNIAMTSVIPSTVARISRDPSLRALAAFGRHLATQAGTPLTLTYEEAGRAAAARVLALELDTGLAAVMYRPASFTDFVASQGTAPLYMNCPLIADPCHRAVADIFPTSTTTRAMNRNEINVSPEAPVVRLLSLNLQGALQEASAALLAEKVRFDSTRDNMCKTQPPPTYKGPPPGRSSLTQDEEGILDSCFAHFLSVISNRGDDEL